MRGPVWTDESGLTLAEILVALAVITIALVVAMQWFPLGVQGVETGRQQSTAVFLAEQKIEQVKAWTLSTATDQGFTTITAGTPSTAQCCAVEGYNAIPGYGVYRRQVTVTDPTATTKLVRVQVFYRPVTSRGVMATESQVEMATLLASR